MLVSQSTILFPGYIILVIFILTGSMGQTADTSGHDKKVEIPKGSAKVLDITKPKKLNTTGTAMFQIQSYRFFLKIYPGNGIDHMNINLVDLGLTGLRVDDEIGVFDGIYCVGSALIQQQDMIKNTLSIPASANDTIESVQNGYIDGHKITLKLYRSEKLYSLYFQTVNNSKDVFVRGGSMFALVDFSKSTSQTTDNQMETIKMYPNPFDKQLVIEINCPYEKLFEVKIYNQNGSIVRTLFNGKFSGQLLLNWDGTDDLNNDVPSGTYYCRINDNMTKIIYNRDGQP